MQLVEEKLNGYDFNEDDRVMSALVIARLKFTPEDEAKEQLGKIVEMGEKTIVHYPELTAFLNECIEIGVAAKNRAHGYPEEEKLDAVITRLKEKGYSAPEEFCNFMVDVYEEFNAPKSC